MAEEKSPQIPNGERTGEVERGIEVEKELLAQMVREKKLADIRAQAGKRACAAQQS